MMKSYYIRPLRQDEIKQFVEWLHANREQNAYDPELIKRGQVVVYAVGTLDDGIVGYGMYRFNVVLDSLAWSPTATPFEKASAIRLIAAEGARRGIEANCAEAEFNVSDPSIGKFAESHGWEKMPRRMKLNLNRLK